MENHELIAKFNPSNAGNLTAEDIGIMRTLNDEQIAALAKAYPDNAMRRSYLVLSDDKLEPNKQLYQMSTWEKLHNIRKFSNLKNFHPFDFIENWKRNNPGVKPTTQRSIPAKPRQTVDLTAQQATEELNKVLANRKKTPAPTTTAPAADVKKPARKTATLKEKVTTTTAPPAGKKAAADASEDFTDRDDNQ